MHSLKWIKSLPSQSKIRKDVIQQDLKFLRLKMKNHWRQK